MLLSYPTQADYRHPDQVCASQFFIIAAEFHFQRNPLSSNSRRRAELEQDWAVHIGTLTQRTRLY